MSTKVIIEEPQRAFVVRDGLAQRYLAPGCYRRLKLDLRSRIERFELRELVVNLRDREELVALVPAEEAEVLTIAAGHAGLLRLWGVPRRVLPQGRYLCWRLPGLTAESVDLRPLCSMMPLDFVEHARPTHVEDIVVAEGHTGLVFVDGRFERSLVAGRYLLSTWRRRVRVYFYDMRELELETRGQAHKLRSGLRWRVSLSARIQVRDPVRLAHWHACPQRAVAEHLESFCGRWLAHQVVDNEVELRTALLGAATDELRRVGPQWGIELLSLTLAEFWPLSAEDVSDYALVS